MSDWAVVPETAPVESEWSVVPDAPAGGTDQATGIPFILRAAGAVKRGALAGAKAVGALGTDALDAVSGNLYSKGLDAAYRAVSPKLADETAATVEEFNIGHPYLASSARAVGYLAPVGPAAAAARIGETIASKAAGALPGLAARVVGSRPVAGGITGAIGAGGTSAVEAATSGASPGEVLKEAGKNALVGGVVGAGIGGVGAAASKVKGALMTNAEARATKDIAHDIIAAEGPKARATDQQRIGEVNNRLFELTAEKPELRSVWRESAEKALPKVIAVKKQIAEPLDRIMTAVDEKTGGGIKLGDVIGKMESEVAELSRKPSTLPDADKLKHVVAQFKRAWGEPKFELSGQAAEDVAALRATRENIADGSPTAAEIDQQIGAIEKTGKRVDSFDPEKRIPTKDFRAEVTNLHKTAEQAMGTIEGTAKHEALAKLYGSGKRIIDEHLNASGLGEDELRQLRKINDQYFLLSRAQAAIESRGVKESNRHTGPLHIPHSAQQAARSSLPLTVGYALTHPHAIPGMMAVAAGERVIPPLLSRANWSLAREARAARSPAYASAVKQLAQTARAATSPRAFVQQAVAAGLGETEARKIYNAAHPVH